MKRKRESAEQDAPVTGDLVAQQRRFAELMIPVPTAATYDTTTEGKTGWRFVLTRRWVAFFVGVLVYLGGCVAGVLWQAQIGEQIASFNAVVHKNFNATPVALDAVLPTLTSYRASEEWKPITATGTYLPANQLFVDDRTCGSNTGFEVLTPFKLSNGRLLIVDRGCVSSSSANPNLPRPTAAPPTGTVTVVARVVTGEGAQGSVSAAQAAAPSIADQIDSIDLHQIAKRMNAPTYTGAYGMLASQTPAPAKSLHPVLSGKPTVDGSAQEGTIFGTVLYAIVGLVIFGIALRTKFRWVNRFSPKLWQREWRRIQREARRAPTDGEIEDMQIAAQQAPKRASRQDVVLRDEPASEESTISSDDDVIIGSADWQPTKPKR